MSSPQQPVRVVHIEVQGNPQAIADAQEAAVAAARKHATVLHSHVDRGDHNEGARA